MWSWLVTNRIRITSASATLKDLMTTNKPDIITSLDVVHSPVADHELTSAWLHISKPKKNIKRFGATIAKMTCKSLLNEISTLNSILQTYDDMQVFFILTNNFMKCMDICASIVTRKVTRPSVPWTTDDIRAAVKTRDQLRKRFE